VIENFFVSGVDEPLRVYRHVNPDGSMGGYVCLNVVVNPHEKIEFDEIVLSEKEYTNKNLFERLVTMTSDFNSDQLGTVSLFCPQSKYVVKLHIGWKKS
jgi:hypothetical protein